MTPGTVARLHLLTPEHFGDAELAAVDRVLDAGAPLLQVRLKDVTDRDRLAVTRRLRARCRAAGATCIVNDRVDLALAVDADGVHLGAHDLPVEVARGILGPAALVGGTCRNPDDARRAEVAGASYVGAGPVSTSTTKDGLPDPIGVEMIERIAAAVSIPVIAIGGVTASLVPDLRRAGAHGIAVVAAVFGAPDPAAATAELLDALEALEALDAVAEREVAT
jgi:thiamine-phosphate pyrophosphorylase